MFFNVNRRSADHSTVTTCPACAEKLDYVVASDPAPVGRVWCPHCGVRLKIIAPTQVEATNGS